jgi:hypothetical protein
MGPESGDTEKACQSQLGGGITSGGGISRRVSLPAYQRDVVEKFLADHSAIRWPGRGYPDIR